jgi:P2 family phage contractile tail tube protein
MAIRRLSNARFYVEGVEQPGICQSFELPEVEVLQVEYSSLGMVGSIELPASIEAMEATATWLHYPPEIAQLIKNPSMTTQVSLRADQATFNSQGMPTEGLYAVTLRLRPKNVGMGTFEKGEATTPETTFAVDYIKVVVDGAEQLEIDASSTLGIKVQGQTVNLVGR